MARRIRHAAASLSGRAAPALCVAFLTAFGWKHLRTILTSTVQFDDAFIANVAKNLAEGHGYSASYYGLHPFHLEITTGPTLILPTAMMIRLFGNGYWVPTLTYTIVVAVLIALLLWALRRRLPEGAFSNAAALISMALLAFGAQEIGLLGELPAALLTALAALVVTRDTHRWRAIVAGLLLGAAIMAKTVAALALPAFVVATLTLPMFRTRRVRTASALLIGAAGPIAGFALAKLVVIGSLGGWTTLLTNELLDVIGPNAPLSGSATVFSALSDPHVLIRNSRHNLEPLLAWWGGTRNPAVPPIWYGGWVPAALATAGVLCTVVVAFGELREERAGRAATAGLMLISTGVTSFLWWLALAPMGWPRHALPGLIRTLIGSSVVIAAAVPRNRRLATVGTILLALSFVPNAFELRNPLDPFEDVYDDIRNGLERNRRLQSALATVSFLHEIESSGRPATLVGCGWSHNPALEYLMPGSDHFRDCIMVRRKNVAGKRLLLVRGEYFNQLQLRDIKRFQDWCERRVLFRALPWVVSECDGLPPEWP